VVSMTRGKQYYYQDEEIVPTVTVEPVPVTQAVAPNGTPLGSANGSSANGSSANGGSANGGSANGRSANGRSAPAAGPADTSRRAAGG
jgi:hypothetical protein